MSVEDQLKDLKRIADYGIEKGLAFGADRVFVSCSYGKQSRVCFEKSDFNLAAKHEGTGLSITVHCQQKCGSASINTHNKQDVDAALKRALTLAKHSVKDDNLAMAPKSSYADIDLPSDPELTNLKLDQVIEMGKLLVSNLQTPLISVDNASVELSHGSRLIANSLGMEASDSSSSLNWSAMGMAIDGDDITSFDYESDFSSQWKLCPAGIEATAHRLSKKLISQLGAKKAPQSYRGQVLLCPTLLDELLLDPCIYHMVGGNIMDGKSRFEKSIGDTITNINFSLHDHPHDPTMRGCTAYSGEGVPTQTTTLIDKGTLKSHCDSVYSAKCRGTRATGNGGGPHAAVVTPGATSLNNLITAVDSPLLAPTRFSGNIDPITGDFSGLAKGGRWWNRGEDLGPVKELMIAGNAFEILNKPLLLSREVESDGGSFKLPYALVDGISVNAD